MDVRKVGNVLLLSHEMSMTGAPVALQYMAKQLKDDGIFVTVLTPEDGPMVDEMLEDDIPVIVDRTIGGNTEWIKWASNFDLVVVNTVVLFHNIVQLENYDIPVIWWIHDGEMSFQLGAKKTLPQRVGPNIHVYVPGEYTCRVVKRHRPQYEVNNLLYCVPDYADKLSDVCRYVVDNPDNKKIILSVGSIDARKGQDIMVSAIRKLKKEDIEKCLFVFIGKNNDDKIYQHILMLKKEYPDNVRIIPYVSRNEIMDIYKQCTVVVCTSRDDPMPVFMTESMIMGIPVICSDTTGTYGLINDGENGLTFQSQNEEELMEKISYAIHNEDIIKKMGNLGRKVYENNFTREAFRSALYQMIEKI